MAFGFVSLWVLGIIGTVEGRFTQQGFNNCGQGGSCGGFPQQGGMGCNQGSCGGFPPQIGFQPQGGIGCNQGSCGGIPQTGNCCGSQPPIGGNCGQVQCQQNPFLPPIQPPGSNYQATTTTTPAPATCPTVTTTVSSTGGCVSANPPRICTAQCTLGTFTVAHPEFACAGIGTAVCCGQT